MYSCKKIDFFFPPLQCQILQRRPAKDRNSLQSQLREQRVQESGGDVSLGKGHEVGGPPRAFLLRRQKSRRIWGGFLQWSWTSGEVGNGKLSNSTASQFCQKGRCCWCPRRRASTGTVTIGIDSGGCGVSLQGVRSPRRARTRSSRLARPSAWHTSGTASKALISPKCECWPDGFLGFGIGKRSRPVIYCRAAKMCGDDGPCCCCVVSDGRTFMLLLLSWIQMLWVKWWACQKPKQQ